MPPSPDTGVECYACVCDYACRGGIGVCSLRGERVVVPQSGGGCCGRGLLQAGRGSRSTAPSIRLAWLSDGFVVFRAREIWRRGPRALELRRVGAGRLCKQRRLGEAGWCCLGGARCIGRQWRRPEYARRDGAGYTFNRPIRRIVKRSWAGSGGGQVG